MNGPRKIDDESEVSALRSGLKAKRLSPEALRRVRQAAHAEWRATLADSSAVAPPRSGVRWKFATAAALLLLTGASVMGVLAYRGSAAGPLVATVVRGDAPGIELERRWRANVPVRDGGALRVPAQLVARGDALLHLAGGGNLRVARESQFDVPRANTLRLTRGEVYLDIPPGTRGTEPFVVVTPAGEFRHVGTQFGVAIIGDRTRLRVREGRVHWQGEAGEEAVEAGTELLIDERVLARRSLASSGREWAWAESLAPDFEIENRPLQEFLVWFSRETGRKLELADDDARRQAATILMHGSVRGLGMMEALAAVMASTTLRYELPAGTIRVSSVRDPRSSR